jgi:hypothetical protein
MNDQPDGAVRVSGYFCKHFVTGKGGARVGVGADYDLRKDDPVAVAQFGIADRADQDVALGHIKAAAKGLGHDGVK